jgi:hypothetical protein
MDPIELNPAETQNAIKLLRGLKTWLKHFDETSIDEMYNDAFDSVNKAIINTIRYQKRLREGSSRDDDTERSLSSLWSEASSQIRPFDSNLSYLCMVKGHGWADDSIWSKPEYKNLPLQIDKIVRRLKKLSDRTTMDWENRHKKTERYLVFGFGVFFIITILVLAIFFPRPDPFPYTVFRVVLALAAAGIAVFIPGFLNIRVGNVIRAGGALAVFIAVYKLEPAQLVTSSYTSEAIHKVVPDGYTFEQYIKEVENQEQVIIKFASNCDTTVKRAIISGGGAQLDGENLKDFLEKIKFRVRDDINYTVREILKGNRYEITCH